MRPGQLLDGSLKMKRGFLVNIGSFFVYFVVNEPDHDQHETVTNEHEKILVNL